MDDYLDVLRNEFDAGNGSFLIQIRVHLDWQKESFTRLITAMQIYCERSEYPETLDRWITHGFWYIPGFVRDWTTHPSFPQDHSEEYYEQANERLDDLAYWFFTGKSPYEGNSNFTPI